MLVQTFYFNSVILDGAGARQAKTSQRIRWRVRHDTGWSTNCAVAAAVYARQLPAY